jgi:hypothetical protein
MVPVLDRYSDLRPPVPDHAPPYSQVYLTELANWRKRADERHFKTKQREYRERRRAKVEMTMEEREAARVEKEGAEKAKKEALAEAQAELVERAKKRREESLSKPSLSSTPPCAFTHPCFTEPCECHFCAEVAGTSLFRSLSRAPKVRRGMSSYLLLGNS